MSVDKLVRGLNNAAIDGLCCLGCGYENNCRIHGCQMLKQAAVMLTEMERTVRYEREHREKLAYWLQGKTPKAEQQAIFRLGQKDMQANAAVKLRDAAAKMEPGGVVGSTLLLAADLIQGMEVP